MILSQPIDMLPDLTDPTLVGAWLNKAVRSSGKDYGPLGYDGTVNGTIKFEEVGMYSLGDLDFLDVGDITEIEGVEAFTVAIWVRNIKDVIAATGDETIMAKSDGGADTFELSWTQGENVGFNVNTSGGSATGVFTDGITNGKSWNRIVGVYNGTDVRVYINGVLGDVVAALTGTTIDSVHGVTIGDSSGGGVNDGWQGWLKAAEIYAGAKSASWAAYDFQRCVPDDSLVLAVDGGVDKSRYKHALTNLGVIVGKGMYYDGSVACKTDSTFQATLRSSFSIGMWFKSDDGQPVAQQYLCGVVNLSVEDYMQIYVTSAGLIGFNYTSNANAAVAISASALLSNGQEWWHRLWAVADSTIGGVGGLVMYLDGEPITLGASDGDTSGVTFADYTNVDELFFGARNHNGAINGGHACYQDDMKVIDRAISAGYAKLDYEQNNTLHKGRY